MKAILNSFNNILYSNKVLLKVITLENAVFIVDKVILFVISVTIDYCRCAPVFQTSLGTSEVKLMEFIFARQFLASPQTSVGVRSSRIHFSGSVGEK